MIKFNYIIGANIELTVEARILPAEPDVNYQGGVDIESVKLNGMDVETDDIYIKQRSGIQSLDSRLHAAAMERASEENENG